jgi:hypothetical protein
MLQRFLSWLEHLARFRRPSRPVVRGGVGMGTRSLVGLPACPDAVIRSDRAAASVAYLCHPGFAPDFARPAGRRSYGSSPFGAGPR